MFFRLIDANMSKLTFKEKVLKIVSQIPAGQVLTYQQVAIKAGRPKAYRAVGNILSKNYNPRVPCHRVIRSDGELGGYNRGVDKKAKLLKVEKGRLAIINNQ